MISKIYSIAVNGLESEVIEIEVDINAGLPSFTIVWLPDTSVQESKERLRCAFKSSNCKLPSSRITVNLAPADIRKMWPIFDLPIWIWILQHSWYIMENDILESSIFIGELSLDGTIRWVNSVLPTVLGAKEKWFRTIFLPYDNYMEASIIEGIQIYAVQNLMQLVKFLNHEQEIINPEKSTLDRFASHNIWTYDFQHVIGQYQAKRALEIAAAWMHNIIMSWPPWSGKTLLAKTFMSILPDLTLDEMIEISKIYSISWLLSKEYPLITKRPFRTIHHTASAMSIIGWGRNAKPGEISLSHKWVLFLDEILEFPKTVLEVLRQPLEDGVISVNRVQWSYLYPAKFVLLGAMNPCPCGYLTDPDKECICTNEQVKRYNAKLSGPMMDRIDIMIEVPKVKIDDFVSKNTKPQETSNDIMVRVQKARQIQAIRFANTSITSNSQMNSKQVEQFCALDDMCQKMMQQALQVMNLSARAYYRILKLARTIADLEWFDMIQKQHIAEALSYRRGE